MKEIKIKLFNQYPPKRSENYSEIVLNVLKASPVPLPLNFISFLVGLPKFKVCKILKKLEKYHPKELKKITITKACFYSFDDKKKKKGYFGLVIMQ